MTQRNVESFLGRIATDPEMRRRFARDPHDAVSGFQEEGHELTAVEARALHALRLDAVERFAASLDARIQRGDVAPAAEA
jgi:hypothetical protein